MRCGSLQEWIRQRPVVVRNRMPLEDAEVAAEEVLEAEVAVVRR